jgi:RNA polymerase sigma-70 factor (ECF subfamily)
MNNNAKATVLRLPVGAAAPDPFADELARLRPTLRTRALLLLQNEAAADDLVQDTMERALANRHQFRSGTNLKAWTGSVMRNLFIDGWRKTAMHHDVDPDDLAGDVGEWDEVGPIDLLVTDDVRAAVARLPPRQREMFDLAYFQGLAHREIAERFQLPGSTVGTSLFRAKAKLRKMLQATFARKVRARGCATVRDGGAEA